MIHDRYIEALVEDLNNASTAEEFKEFACVSLIPYGKPGQQFVLFQNMLKDLAFLGLKTKVDHRFPHEGLGDWLEEQVQGAKSVAASQRRMKENCK